MAGMLDMLEHIKAKIPERYKVAIKLIPVSGHEQKWRELASGEKRKVYVFLAGFYQNLGDIAITFAQIRFLHRYLEDVQVIAVPAQNTYTAVKTIRNYIRPDDLVTIIGGGNMSDTYLSLEDARRYVVKSFPGNKIISFPQTILYSDKRELNRSRKIYSRHKDLTIFARERESFNRAKCYFPSCRIELCPDIVLSLNEFSNGHREDKVLCCLRKDGEKAAESEQISLIEQKLNGSRYKIIYKDTVDVPFSECNEKQYEKALNSYWDLVKTSKLVLTDRLHCMLFCAITGTPCIALDNSNHKVRGVYDDWLSDVPYIHFCDGIVDEAGLQRYLSEAEAVSEIPDREAEFDTLKNALHE